ncbi:serine/threonine-protein kinase [Candidatus Uabimicrobium sp. HlEnr_7]|uniref:serine/threonine-protein kinase n=1 Tax=Candidatus Uabimicrobium helgolandensis TaxID=3095367 RepID=UPI0035591219
MRDSNEIRNLLGFGITKNDDPCSMNLNLEKYPRVDFYCGKKINHYLLLHEIGRGGMGVVYSALDTNLNRKVALKIILLPDTQNSNKLLREAKVVAQLNHQNIIRIFEVYHSPIFFFTMELIDGISLHQFIYNHRKKVKNKEYFLKLASIFVKIANTLNFVHEKSIIHRDIKPENIMLDGNLNPIVMDFGIAKLDTKTMSNEFKGTPIYMSPEQIEGKKLTLSTDIYSLGVTLYEAISTQCIFQNSTIVNLFYQIIHDDPISLRSINPKVPKELEAICFKCMSKKANKRYPSMTHLGNDLKKYINDKPVSAKPIGNMEKLAKLIIRNKLLTITLVCVACIIILLLYISFKAKDYQLQIAQNKIEIGNKLQREKEQLYLKRDLQLAYLSVKGQKINSAQKYLDDAKKKSYSSKNAVEINWLQNKISPQKLEMNIFDGKKILSLNNGFALVKSSSILFYKWDFSKKNKISIHNIINVGVNLDTNKIAIIHGEKSYFVTVYDLQTCKPLFRHTLNYQNESSCYFYSNDTLLLAGNKQLNIFKINSFHLQKISQLSHHQGSFVVKSFTKKKNTLFYTHGEYIFYHDFSNKNPHRFTFSQKSEYCASAYDRESDSLVVASLSALSFLDSRTFTEKNVIHNDFFSTVLKIRTSKDYVFALGKKGKIFVLNKTTGATNLIHNKQKLIDFIIHQETILCISKTMMFVYNYNDLDNPKKLNEGISAKSVFVNKNSFNTCSALNELFVYNLKEHKSKKIFLSPKPFGRLHHYFLNPKNNKVFYTVSSPREIYNHNEKITHCFPHAFEIIHARLNNLLYLYNQFKVDIWCLQQERIIDNFSFPIFNSPPVKTATICPEERYILFAFSFFTKKSFLCVFDTKLKTYQKIEIKYQGDNIRIKIIKVGKQYLLLISFEKVIQVWNFNKLLKNEYSYFQLNGHKYDITCFTPIQDGAKLVSIDKENHFIFWDISSKYFEKDRLLLDFDTEFNILDCAYVESLDQLITVGSKILVWDFGRKMKEIKLED